MMRSGPRILVSNSQPDERNERSLPARIAYCLLCLAEQKKEWFSPRPYCLLWMITIKFKIMFQNWQA